ncbi:glucan biosynthesis protein [Coraliomargarita sp. SDUM461004]|uniref:Glucans biosynthesis protein G n=1 Tax=Thalassobacterium sedimentorum TaxID=3041258 RepID=A0ABU1AKM2_9BACT|nr:glucan biosynthesis protein [Coraliomargarita sp. SDUM461004]MDQ8195214.1 glucan biosynthesis protein [Coraliomargarita sp. SDUM461004]
MKVHLTLLVICTLGTLSGQQERKHITLDTVAEEAQALIQQAPREPEELPENLKALSYDQYRDIRFRPSEALWWNADSRFRVEFFHPGHLFNNQINIYETSNTHVQEIPFMKEAFDYGNSGYDPGFFKKPKGYSGIRVKYPLNNEEIYDELIVFLGASYFRALGAGHHFGLSLRGLSMNTIGAEEDFPRFTKLWIRKPKPKDKHLTLFALLEGKKVTGAYQFDVHSKGVTEIDVRTRLFFRDGGEAEVGIAPLTSMFVHGENTNAPAFHDWRPEVHDSDGMLVHANSEWDWFPIENLPGQTIRRMPTAKLRGFGLLQRDRDFRNYKDLEAHYQLRPSAWVEPKGKWSPGEIILYTFGTDTEATDNVTAFWKPDLQEAPTEGLEFSYRITLQTKDPAHTFAKVMETRVGQRTLDGHSTTLIIEFSRPESIALDEIESLSVGFDYGRAEPIEAPIIQYSQPEDRIRVFANFKTSGASAQDRPYQMSAQLLREGHQVSERWNYTWKP